MKVITLNQAVFSETCAELMSKIEVQPDMVVGILNGGGYIVKELKKKKGFESANFEYIKLQRGEKAKKEPVFQFLLKHLPYTILNKLRVFESKKARKSIQQIDKNQIANDRVDLKINSNIEKPIRTILIIDDAIDTGKTLFVVKNNLTKLFPEAQIISAVISWTIETSIVKPDYYIFENMLVRYPWSKDYKGKDKF